VSLANQEKVYGTWRPQKYFATKAPLSGMRALFISVGMLIGRFRMNEKTLRNGISKFMQGGTPYYHAFRDGDSIMVAYDSLPANQKSKLKLPKDSEGAYALIRGEHQLEEKMNRDVEFKHLKGELEELYRHRWPKFLKFYEKKIADRKKRIPYAQSHALIYGVLELTKVRWPSKIIFEAVRQIMVAELDAAREPIFYSFSPIYFWRKIAKCKERGIAPTLVHEMRGVAREYRVKMTGQIKAFARLLLRDPKRLTIQAIINAILKKFRVDLSPSTIKSLKHKTLDRNVLEYDSNGKEWSRQNGLPKITRFLAQSPGDQFQGDYYQLQFFCLSNKIIVRLWAYIVLDVMSKNWVGWSLSEVRTARQATEAFKMAFVEHQILPEEIIIDNDKLYNRNIFKRFRRRINNLGVITTFAEPNIPTWKAEIESSFSVFQKMHADKPGYIGEGLRSKNFAGNPAPEVRKKLYKDKRNMRTVEQMQKDFAVMVKEYNAMTNYRKKKVSPQETFRQNKPKHAIKLEEWMEPFLFWKTKTKKMIKDDGRIDLEIDRIAYCYQITKAEMLWQYKNSEVRMCYDPNNLSKIYIFERFTFKFIGVIEPRMKMDRDNKYRVLGKQRKIINDAQQYIRDERLRDEDLANGVKRDRPPVSRESLEDKMIRRKMRQQKLEDEVMAVEVQED
jgi:hypothetical protein